MKHSPPVKMGNSKVRSPDRGSLLLQEPRYMNDRVITALLSILNDYPDHSCSDWPQHEVEDWIFSRWAVEEMLNQIWDHPWTLASDTVEAFALKLELYAATSNTEEQRMIFKTAAETAWTMLEGINEIESL